MPTSIGSDNVRLVERNLATGAQEELASDDAVDVDNVVGFRCSVDIFGVSNLTTFMKSIPPYWTAFRAILRQRVGDRKEQGRATYVMYTDEGARLHAPENNLDFTARAESFLAACLSGRAEPMQQARYPGSTAVMKEWVANLSERGQVGGRAKSKR